MTGDGTTRPDGRPPGVRFERWLLAAALLAVGALYLSTLPTFSSNDGYGYVLAFEGHRSYSDYADRVDPPLPGAPHVDNLGLIHPHHPLTNLPAYLLYRAGAALGLADGAQRPFNLLNVIWTLVALGALYVLLRRFVRPGAAATATAVMAVASGQWVFATSNEVYAGGEATLLLVLLVFERIWRGDGHRLRDLVLLGCLQSLAMLGHSVNWALAVPIIALLVTRVRGWRLILELAVYGGTVWGMNLAVLITLGATLGGLHSIGDLAAYVLLHPLWIETSASDPGLVQSFPTRVWLTLVAFFDLVALPSALSWLVKLALGGAAAVGLGHALRAALRSRRRGGGAPPPSPGPAAPTRTPGRFVLYVVAAWVTYLVYLARWDFEARDYPVVAMPLFAFVLGWGLQVLSDRTPARLRRALPAAALALVVGTAAHSWATEISARRLSHEEAARHVLVSSLTGTTPSDLILLNFCVNHRELWWLRHELRPAAPVGDLGVVGFAETVERIRAVTAAGGTVHVAMVHDPMEATRCQQDRWHLPRLVFELGDRFDLAVELVEREDYHPGPEINTWYSYRLAQPIEKWLFRITARR